MASKTFGSNKPMGKTSAYLINEAGNIVAEIRGVNTFKGARTALKKCSFAFADENYTIRLEQRLYTGK